MPVAANITIPQARIEQFCRRWKIAEFALFGSVLRDTFQDDSDIDVVIRFAEEARWSLFDWVQMRDELKELFDRDVDLVEQTAIRNPIRRREILRTREVLYAS